MLARVNNLSTKCCGGNSCAPYVLASAITNGAANPTWDIARYHGEGVAKGDYWRIKEVGAGTVYGMGCISEEGELVDLPASFTSQYLYDGYMEIQIGCYLSDDEIRWP